MDLRYFNYFKHKKIKVCNKYKINYGMILNIYKNDESNNKLRDICVNCRLFCIF